MYAAEQAWDRCLAAAERGLALDPYCETFITGAASAYRALGRPWAAARLLRRTRQRLELDREGRDGND